MDMEHELHALRIQLAEKSKHSLLLQKEVCLLPFSSVDFFDQFLSAILVAIVDQFLPKIFFWYNVEPQTLHFFFTFRSF